MATIKEITQKVIDGTATSADFAELAKLSKEEEKNLKAVETSAEKIITDIKALNIKPEILTKLLANAGLIIVDDEKKIILEEAVKTKAGTDSKFKIWIGRDVAKLAGEAKKHYEALQAKGKEYFIGKLNEAGKAYYATEDGKKWIDGLFAKK